MKIQIYTIDTCPYCSAAKGLLDQKGLGYEEVDLTNNPDLRQKISEKQDYRTVPMIFIDEKFIGGFSDLQALDAEGKL